LNDHTTLPPLKLKLTKRGRLRATQPCQLNRKVRRAQGQWIRMTLDANGSGPIHIRFSTAKARWYADRQLERLANRIRPAVQTGGAA
jgi:hypothetical protein